MFNVNSKTLKRKACVKKCLTFVVRLKENIKNKTLREEGFNIHSKIVRKTPKKSLSEEDFNVLSKTVKNTEK